MGEAPRPISCKSQAWIELLQGGSRQTGNDWGGDDRLGNDDGDGGVDQVQVTERSAAPERHGDE